MRFRLAVAATILLAAPSVLGAPQAGSPPRADAKPATAKPADATAKPADATAKPADTTAKPSDAAAKPPDTHAATGSAKPAAAKVPDVPAKLPTATGPRPQLRLTDTRAKVDELAASMKRLREMLASVSDQVMSPVVGATATEIVLRNEMSGAYRLVHTTIRLDGSVLVDREDDSGTLADQKELPILKGAVAPGDHALSVELIFQGSGYGVFSYLKGYRYNVKSTHALAIGQGKPVNLDIVVYEKGDATTPLDQRPAIDWKDRLAPRK